jgi:hypothetical protein
MAQGNITYSITPTADRQGAKSDGTYHALRGWTLRKYGLTHETYEAKHAAQGGVCAICGKPEASRREGRLKRLAVDHSRATGRVRDLLCCRCNQAIGLLREDPAIMRQAAAYIERHSADSVFERVPTMQLPIRGDLHLGQHRADR